jgi:hypothetical protein
VGSQFEPSLTWDGLRNLLGDIRRNGERIPAVLLVSERDRRNLNQEILGNSVTPVAKDDQRPEHDNAAIGFVDGVMIRSHPDVPNGRARLLYTAYAEAAKPLPSGRLISLPNV